ncbi:MAG: hypothetical protein AAFR61_17620 [Bacteroidota bacterium]
MSFSLDIHPHVGEDVMDIFLFIDQNSPQQADLFAEHVLYEYDKILTEWNNNVFYQKGRIVKSRPVGKFNKYMVFYTVDEVQQRVEVLAVLYGGLNPEKLSELIAGRLRS